MDVMFFQTLLTAPYALWLPDVALARWAMHGTWGLVLGAAALGLGAAFSWRWRWPMALGVVVWALWPGPASPAYWLGLAFQSPSLTGVGLCVVLVVRVLMRHPVTSPASPHLVWPWVVLAGAAVLLGWVLLFDMLAWWPVSVYAWGFSPAALMWVGGLVLLLWVTGGKNRAGRSASLCLAAVLTVFVVTRLPSGNLWDALLDPWLWTALQVAGVLALIRRRSSPREWSVATRA